MLRVTVWLTWKWLLRPLLTTNRTPSICKGNTSEIQNTSASVTHPWQFTKTRSREHEGSLPNLYICGGTPRMCPGLGEEILSQLSLGQIQMFAGRMTRGASWNLVGRTPILAPLGQPQLLLEQDRGRRQPTHCPSSETGTDRATKSSHVSKQCYLIAQLKSYTCKTVIQKLSLTYPWLKCLHCFKGDLSICWSIRHHNLIATEPLALASLISIQLVSINLACYSIDCAGCSSLAGCG